MPEQKKSKVKIGNSVKIASVEFKNRLKQLCCCNIADGGPGTELPH